MSAHDSAIPSRPELAALAGSEVLILEPILK